MGIRKSPTKDDVYALISDTLATARKIRENMAELIMSENITSERLEEIKKLLEEMSTNMKLYLGMESCLGLDTICLQDTEINNISEAIDGTKKNIDFVDCYLDYCDSTNQNLTLTCNFFCRHVLSSLNILKSEYGELGYYEVADCNAHRYEDDIFNLKHICAGVRDSLAYNDSSRSILKRLLDGYEGGELGEDVIGILIENNRAIRNKVGMLVDLSKNSESICPDIAMTANLIKVVNFARTLASLLDIYTHDDDCSTLKVIGVHYEVVEVMNALLKDTRDGLGCTECLYDGGEY